MLDEIQYKALMRAVSAEAAAGSEEAREDLEFLEGHQRNFLGYVHAVGLSEIGINAAEVLLEGETLRARVSELDGARTAAHNAAIASAGAINRIAAAYGVGPVYLGDLTRRREVAQFCLEFTELIFRERR